MDDEKVCDVCGKKDEVFFRRRETGETEMCSECNIRRAKQDGYVPGDVAGHPTGTAA